jgi:hypothetical protein
MRVLKWILIGACSLAAAVAVFIGIVWFLFTRDGDDASALTEPGSAEVLELTDAGSSYIVVYRYDFDGQTFYGKTSIYRKSMYRGDTYGICVNPSNPSQHTEMNPGCPPEVSNGVFEGEKQRPSL